MSIPKREPVTFRDKADPLLAAQLLLAKVDRVAKRAPRPVVARPDVIKLVLVSGAHAIFRADHIGLELLLRRAGARPEQRGSMW